MKTFLAALVFFCIAIFAAAGLVGLEVERGFESVAGFMHHANRDLSESRAYYRAVLPRVLADPRPDILTQVWAPEARERPFDALNARIANQLGPFARCDGARQTLDSSYEAELGLLRHTHKTEVTATFRAICHFRAGAVETTTVLRKLDGDWGVTKLELSAAARPDGAAI